MSLNKSEILEEYPEAFAEGFFRNSFFKNIENKEVVCVGCRLGEKNDFIPEIALIEIQEGVLKILCQHKNGDICSITEKDCEQEFEIKTT